MEAVVLAAGKGERLWPLTETRPKPLLPVGNRPILERSLEALVHAGIQKISLVVNYKSEMIQESIGNGSRIGCEIEYIKQNLPRGTADAVRTAGEKFSRTDRFVVMYGDDFFDREAVKSFVASAEKIDGCTIGTYKVEDASPFGKIETKDGLVTAIREKLAKAGPGLVNSGLYLLDQTVFSAVKKTPRSKRGEFELTDSLSILIKNGQTVHSDQLKDLGWLGISYPWDLLDANERVLTQEKVSLDGSIEDGVQLKGSVVLEEDTVVKSGSQIEGPVHVGKRCHIGPNAYLRAHTSLGDDVKVGAACEIKNSVVMKGAKIPHLSYVGDSVIGAECSLGAGTITANLRFDEAVIKSRVKAVMVDSGRKKLGAILGDHVRTGINVSIFPGVKIGQGAWVGPSATVMRDVMSGARIKA